MPERKQVEINLEEERKNLSDDLRIALFIAEKKFGPLSKSNLDTIKEYVTNFDVNKEPYKSDTEKYLTDENKKTQLTKKNLTNDQYMALKYYNEYYQNNLNAWYRNRNIIKPDSNLTRDKLSMLGLALSYISDNNFYELVDQFYEKYGFFIDGDYILDRMINGKNYKKEYEEYFRDIYSMATHKEAIDEMFQDYENIVRKGRLFEGSKLSKKYDNGGMSIDEVTDLLKDLVSYEYDLSRKNREEINSKCVDNSNKVEVEKVIEFVENKVNRENNFDKLVDAAAALKELKAIHREKGFLYKLFNKAAYQQEEDRINALQANIIGQSKKVTNNNAIEESLISNDVIYDPRKRLEDVSISQFRERTLSKINIELENDAVENDFEEVKNNAVENDLEM